MCVHRMSPSFYGLIWFRLLMSYVVPMHCRVRCWFVVWRVSLWGDASVLCGCGWAAAGVRPAQPLTLCRAVTCEHAGRALPWHGQAHCTVLRPAHAVLQLKQHGHAAIASRWVQSWVQMYALHSMLCLFAFIAISLQLHKNH